jgi:16S rRNA (guanine527-N7)-methyltransferase
VSDTETRLRQFADLVESWSAKINLVSRGDRSLIWSRHVADSRALIAHIPAGTRRAIDLGSGAGFPGMVLAIETGIAFTLIESDTRKAIFLREAARHTGAPVIVVNARIETAMVEPAMLITARALAPLPELLALAAPHLARGGVCLFPKGRSAEIELTAAKRLWHMVVEHAPSPLDTAACVLKVSELRHVDTQIPQTTPRDRDRQPERRGG